jgi:hypothetical protein
MMDDKSTISPELWPTKARIVSSRCLYTLAADLRFVLSKRKQIQRFVQGVSAGDHLFFYCQKIRHLLLLHSDVQHSTDSGHGRQVPCHHHTESDGLDEGTLT